MMKKIQLGKFEIPYNIVKKKNKHTYYYFRKEGYIQIHLSKYQSEQQVLTYMVKNKDKFIAKYSHYSDKKHAKIDYLIWGNVVQKIHDAKVNNFTYIADTHTLYIPQKYIDHEDKLHQFEKELVQQKLDQLIQKYSHNGYIDISNVKYTIRIMRTRYGSCNKGKRRISINLDLVHYNPQFIEYVFLHEITHLVHGNHAREFYELLETLCPNYKQLRTELKEVW